jgi:hypothetical protein
MSLGRGGHVHSKRATKIVGTRLSVHAGSDALESTLQLLYVFVAHWFGRRRIDASSLDLFAVRAWRLSITLDLFMATSGARNWDSDPLGGAPL